MGCVKHHTIRKNHSSVHVQSLQFIVMLSEKLEPGYWQYTLNSVPCSPLSQKSLCRGLNLLWQIAKTMTRLIALCSSLCFLLSSATEKQPLSAHRFKSVVAHSKMLLRGFLPSVHTCDSAGEHRSMFPAGLWSFERQNMLFQMISGMGVISPYST